MTPGGASGVLAAPARGRPGIGRRAAQQLARAELSKPVYHQHPPLAQRVIAAILRWLHDIFRAAGGTVPGGWWSLVAVAALLVIVTAGLLAWTGPIARTHRLPRPLASGAKDRTARDHRQDSERFARAGDYAAAIRECVRASAAELDERGVLTPRTGRTADEFAEEAALVLPGHASALRAAARLFDEVCYGQRPGSAAGYGRVRELDEEVMVSAPRLARGARSQVPITAGGGPS